MSASEELAFADRVAEFYAREYGFPPVAGRVLGYLLVCRPPEQTIAELSQALLASRSAITGAVQLLAGHNAVRRFRSTGQRVDHVALDREAFDPAGFAAAPYQEQAELARTALSLLEEDSSERRAILQEGADFYAFLAERMPVLLDEWKTKRAALDYRHERT